MVVEHPASQHHINQWDDNDDDEDVEMELDQENVGHQGVIEAHHADEYEDDASSDASSIPDDEIDFTLTYALHTFVATVEGQASVVKGDSLVLLDDANSYWWLVRVLKTEDVGYIPAENIETPFERLARLNKHRNVDLASATFDEAQHDPESERQAAQKAEGRSGSALGKSGSASNNLAAASWEDGSPYIGGGDEDDARERKVVFAMPTYVDHPGVTWSETSEDEEDDDEDSGEEETDRVEDETEQDARAGEVSARDGLAEKEKQHTPADEMEPDDGVAWDESAAAQEQRRVQAERDAAQAQQRQVQAQPQPQSQVQNQTQAQAQARTQAQAAEQLRAQQEQQRLENQRHLSLRPDIQQQRTQAPAQSKPAMSNSASGDLRPSTSSERLLDPADVRDDEPRRITVTPAVARASIQGDQGGPSGYRAPSTATQNGQRSVSAASAASTFSSASYATATSVASSSTESGGIYGGEDEDGKKGRKGKSDKENRKLRKGSFGDESGAEDSAKKRKSAGAVFSGLFKKKEKKDRGVRGGIGSDAVKTSFANDSDSLVGRSSEDSLQATSQPDSGIGRRGQGQVSQPTQSGSAWPAGQGSQAPGGSSIAPAISAHSLRLQQIDQKQQLAYQQYIARSPSNDSIEPASRSFGTQAAATMQTSAARLAVASTQPNGRPGSIILSPNPNAPGMLLSVLRLFVGENMDSDFSFKTMLLSESTTAQVMIRQAYQRFHLSGRQEDYFLTIKEVDGDELALDAEDKPLAAFHDMCERIGEQDAAAQHRTVKRSSVASVSSISSTLSQHPAIAKLGMSDFSDDSNVKLFINKKHEEVGLSSAFQQYGYHGAAAAPKQIRAEDRQQSDLRLNDKVRNKSLQSLTVTTSGASTPDRLHSPSARFTLALVLHKPDLPQGMAFDPTSEAVVSANIAHDRAQASPQVQPPTSRRKLLVLSRNTTVAEAIEAGLERFGITDGVVDGGDDVDDKASQRQHIQKIRYAMAVYDATTSRERLLQASNKLLDAYSTPPKTKVIEKATADMRRRSRDWSVSGTSADLQPSDPVFILRRMDAPSTAALRPQHHASSLPLDDLALRQKRLSDQSTAKAAMAPPQDTRTRQEIIAAQRAASRANQMAILSAQANSAQGVDVVLPDRGTIRSARLNSGAGEEVRYSYTDTDGETYDISQLIQDEWGNEDGTAEEVLVQPSMHRNTTDTSVYRTAPSTPVDQAEQRNPLDRSASRLSTSSGQDLLQSVLEQAKREPNAKVAEKIDRVLAKIKPVPNGSSKQDSGDVTPRSQTPQQAGSALSIPQPEMTPRSADQSRGPREATLSPVLEAIPSNLRRDVDDAPSRSDSRQTNMSPVYPSALRSDSRQSNVATSRVSSRGHRQQPSIASVMSDYSTGDGDGAATTAANGQTVARRPPPTSTPPAAPQTAQLSLPTRKGPIRYTDDYGMTRLMGVIRARAINATPRREPEPELDEVDKLYFGKRLDLDKLHPDMRKIGQPLYDKLDQSDKEIDEMLHRLNMMTRAQT